MKLDWIGSDRRDWADAEPFRTPFSRIGSSIESNRKNEIFCLFFYGAVARCRVSIKDEVRLPERIISTTRPTSNQNATAMPPPPRGGGGSKEWGGGGFLRFFEGIFSRNERWSSHKATSRQRLPRRLYKNMFYEARQHKKNEIESGKAEGMCKDRIRIDSIEAKNFFFRKLEFKKNEVGVGRR